MRKKETEKGGGEEKKGENEGEGWKRRGSETASDGYNGGRSLQQC